jgi:hypothetical protein
MDVERIRRLQRRRERMKKAAIGLGVVAGVGGLAGAAYFGYKNRGSINSFMDRFKGESKGAFDTARFNADNDNNLIFDYVDGSESNYKLFPNDP